MDVQNFNTLEMIEATRQSFYIIEPWAEATSDHDAVKNILGSMRKEAGNYFLSVDQSFKNAHTGLCCAKDAVKLCNWLLEPAGTHSEELIDSYIREMQKIAKEAYEEAKCTAQMFRTNRQNFNEITKGIPDVIDEIKTAQAGAIASKARAERRADNWGRKADRWRNVGARGREVTRNPLYLAGILISLPIAIVMVAGTAAFSAQAKDRERKLIQYDAAAQSLDFALDQLCQLSKQMDVMVAYWLEMSGVLDYILKHANRLQEDVLLQERIKNLKGEWAQVQTSCLQYQQELARLQDYNPISRSMITVSE